MGVDAQSAADAEIVIGLRDRGRKADRIQHADDIAPARAGTRAIRPPRRVGLDHRCRDRRRETVAHKALPAHRVACAAGAHRRPSAAASRNSARNESISAVSLSARRTALRATGTGLSRLASLRTSADAVSRTAALAARGTASAAPAAAMNRRRDRVIMPHDSAGPARLLARSHACSVSKCPRATRAYSRTEIPHRREGRRASLGSRARDDSRRHRRGFLRGRPRLAHHLVQWRGGAALSLRAGGSARPGLVGGVSRKRARPRWGGCS